MGREETMKVGDGRTDKTIIFTFMYITLIGQVLFLDFCIEGVGRS